MTMIGIINCWNDGDNDYGWNNDVNNRPNVCRNDGGDDDELRLLEKDIVDAPQAWEKLTDRPRQNYIECGC